jgi:hypothetical protein
MTYNTPSIESSLDLTGHLGFKQVYSGKGGDDDN